MLPDDTINILNKLKVVDISYSDLGAKNDFVEANKFKNDQVGYILAIVNEYKENSEIIPLSVQAPFENSISTWIGHIGNFVDQITEVATQGIHTAQFPSRRTQLIDWFKQKHFYADQWIVNYHAYLANYKLNNQNYLSENYKIQIELKDSLAQIKKVEKDSGNILQDLRDKISDKVISDVSNSFKSLQEEHSNYESRWFTGFIFSLIVMFIGVIVAVFFFDPPPNADFGQVAKYIIERVILIILPTAIAKICLSKYQIERHLRVLYAHRSAVLSQYTQFEKAIGDSVEAKNAFRLEIAKYLFSDPQTGYIKDGSNSDLNINPVISVLERVTQSK